MQRSSGSRTRARLRRVAAGVSTMLLTGAVLTVGATPASAAAPLVCDQSTIYGLDTNHQLESINVTTGATTLIKLLPNNTNALGVADGGGHAYAFSSGNAASGGTVDTLDDYVAATDTVQQVTPVDAGVAAIRGAVDPKNGLFYYAVNTAASTGSTTTVIGAYDPATGTRLRQVATIRVPTSGSGGDMAFSKAGDLYFLTGNLVYHVDGTVPSVSGTTVLDSTLVTSIAGFTSSPGLAFAADGYLYANNGTTLKQIDPTTGTVTNTVTMSGSFSPLDLAGCNNPSSMSSSVRVDARVHPADQWTVTLGGGSAWPASAKTATTSGTASGVQPATAGPVLALGGGTYTATQTMASGSPGDYDTTWSCSDGTDPAVTGSGSSASVTIPTGGAVNGSDMDCRFTNVAKTGGVSFSLALGAARGSAADQFALQVHDGSTGGPVLANTTTTGSGSTVGAGTAGPAALITGRTAVLTADTAPGSDLTLARYDATATCTDPNNVATGLPQGVAFTGALSVTSAAGADIRCVVTASPKPARLAASVALGGERYDDGDQFTVSLQDSGGTTISPAGAATTTGSGSDVTAGTGTTGAVTAASGAPITVVASSTAHPTRYVRTLTCTDSTGFTTGLPNRASFTGSATITPAAGADIACSVAVEPDVPDLALRIAAPDALAVGAPADYTVTVANQGGRTATPTTRLLLPAGIAYTGVDGAGWSCTATGAVADGQLVTCTGPGVPAGAERALTVHVTPTPSAAGDHPVVRGAVDPTGGSAPADPAGCTSGTSAPGCAVADARLVGDGVALTITSRGPAALVSGVPAQYLLRVANVGTGPAASATVLQRLPEGVRFVRATGASCSADGQLVTCTVPGAIAPGGAVDFAIDVLAQDLAPGGSGVSGVSVDPGGGTAPPAPPTTTPPTPDCPVKASCDSTSTPVRTPALTLTVAVQGATKARLHAGDVVRYVYTLTNTGSAALTGIALSDGTVCPATALEPGARTVCVSSDHVVTQADVDRGRFTRAATASGSLVGCTGGGCSTASNAARLTSLTAAHAALRLVQTAMLHDRDHDGRADRGETVVFRGVVTNTGTVRVAHLRVHGSLVDLHCLTTALAPGAHVICTARHVVRSGDIVGGVVENTAQAVGTSVASGSVGTAHRTASLAAGPMPDLLAATGLDLQSPLGWAAGLLVVALAGLVALRRRAVLRRRR